METNFRFNPQRSKARYSILMLLVVGFFIFSCSKDEPVTPAMQSSTVSFDKTSNGAANHEDNLLPPVPDDAYLFISHGRCMGTCPAYSVMVSARGTVTYVGIANVSTIGPVSFTVNSETVHRIGATLLSIGFLRMPDAFPFVTDVPETVTALRLNSHELKEVIDYGIEVPDNYVQTRKLIEAELGIDHLVNGTGIGTDMNHAATN